MISLLTRKNLRHFYSNIKLNISQEQHTAFLTLSNHKKRNSLALATIQELQSAIAEVSSKVQSEKIKVFMLPHRCLCFKEKEPFFQPVMISNNLKLPKDLKIFSIFALRPSLL